MKNPVKYTAYHGTAEIITAFDPDRTGQGEDQYGSGFYFDTCKEHAICYAGTAFKEHRGEHPNVVCAEITLQKPIIVDGSEPTLESICVTNRQAYKILTQMTGFYNPDIAENPLGDYFADIWTNPPKLEAGFRQYITRLINDFYCDTNIRQLDFLCARWPTEFRTAVRNTLGYDGVIVEFPKSRNIVAWFPEQIEILASEPIKVE